MANPRFLDVTGASTPDPSSSAGASSGGSSASAPSGGGGGGGSSATVARLGEIYDSLVLRPIGANGAQPGENYRVPPGYAIEIWPQPSNAGNFFVAEGPTQVATGPREVFLPGSTGRRYSGIRNVASLWFRFANAADEAVVRIVR